MSGDIFQCGCIYTLSKMRFRPTEGIAFLNLIESVNLKEVYFFKKMFAFLQS